MSNKHIKFVYLTLTVMFCFLFTDGSSTERGPNTTTASASNSTSWACRAACPAPVSAPAHSLSIALARVGERRSALLLPRSPPWQRRSDAEAAQAQQLNNSPLETTASIFDLRLPAPRPASSSSCSTSPPSSVKNTWKRSAGPECCWLYYWWT